MRPTTHRGKDGAEDGLALHLLFIIENYPPHYGGVELVFQNTCEGLAARGHKVTLVTHRLKGTARHERVNGVDIHRVSCLYSRYLFTFLAPFSALCHARKADIIHTTTFNAAPVAWLVGKLTRKKVVLTVHETWIGKWREYTTMGRVAAALHELAERAIFALRYDAYLCVSESTARNLRAVLPRRLHDRIFVNYNGFAYTIWDRERHTRRSEEIRKELGLDGKFVIFAYGRPGTSKGFEYLAQAFPIVARKHKDAHLVLNMPRHPQYESQYRRILRHLGIDAGRGMEGRVTLIEGIPYDQLPPYVAMADCVVVPSLAEGFGYTTVEVNAIGTPVVASNTTSIPEVISGKYILVTPRDPEDIARGIIAVKEKRYKVTALKRFFWKDNLDRVLTTYRRLLRGRNPGAAGMRHSGTGNDSGREMARRELHRGIRKTRR